MSRTLVHRILMLAAAGMGLASVFLRDIDKTPIYALLAYVLWRLD